jgi:hypothetical protein
MTKKKVWKKRATEFGHLLIQERIKTQLLEQTLFSLTESMNRQTIQNASTSVTDNQESPLQKKGGRYANFTKTGAENAEK